MEIAATLAGAVTAECEYEFRCGECLAGLKLVGRCIWVYAGYHAQISHIVHFKCEAEVAGPSECAHQHLSAVLLTGPSRPISKNGSACMAARLPSLVSITFLPACSCWLLNCPLTGPVAAEFREPVLGFVEIQHGRRILPHGNRLLLVVRYVGPGLYYIFFGICHIV